MQELYIKDGKIYNIRQGVETGEGTILYNGTEAEMRALGYAPYFPTKYTPSQESILQEEIETLKLELEGTDYILFKSLEGYDCDSLYPGWKANRKNLRDQINEKEQELENLREPNN